MIDLGKVTEETKGDLAHGTDGGGMGHSQP